MKKIILSTLLIVGTANFIANAQANSVLVFGTAGFRMNSYGGNNKSYTVDISPGVGYQFDQHWTLGATGGFSTARSKVGLPLQGWTYTNNYRAGVFVRNTVRLSKIFNFYNQLEVGYLGSKFGTTNSNIPIENNSSNGFTASLTPAIGIDVWKGFAINFSIGGLDYLHTKVKGASDAYNSLGLTFGNQYNFGISKNFLCRKGKHHAKNNHDQIEKEDIDNSKED